jgi:putative FmdB family regulatory protein
MPTYGYECKSCGYTFDVFQSMSDEPVKVCPECGKEVRRLINGGTGIIFKGSGFYVTDKGKGNSSSKGPTAPTGPAAPASPEKTSGSSPASPEAPAAASPAADNKIDSKAKPEPAKSTNSS